LIHCESRPRGYPSKRAAISSPTFSTTLGNFTKIEEEVDEMQGGGCCVGTGWSINTWTGNAANSIGAGNDGTCDVVTIGGTEYWDGSAYKNGGDTYLATSPLTYTPAP
jgi:hypothetical protein